MRLKVSNVCQLLDKSTFQSITRFGVTATNNGDGTFTVNGTATDNMWLLQPLFQFQTSNPGYHTYLLDINQYSGNANAHGVIYFYDDNTNSSVALIGTGDSSAVIQKINGPIAGRGTVIQARFAIVVLKGTTVTNWTIRPQLYDLTEMYGAGHEPTTVEQFRQDFPNEMYDYSPVCWKKFRRLKYVTDKYGVVDLGTLSWNKYVNGNNWLFYATVPNGKTNVGSGNTVNAFIDKYEYSNIALSGSQAVVKDSPFVCWDATQSQILIKDTNYTDANTFKSSVAGVKLYYELKTPGKGYLPLNRGKYIANKEPVQLLDKSKYPATTTNKGITITNNGDGSITLNGTATSDGEIYSLQYINLINGHKYFIYDNQGGSFANIVFTLDGVGSVANREGNVQTCNITSGPLRRNAYFYVVTGTVISNKVYKPQIFNLTAMYGAGNEPTTVAQFRADHPNELYDYNPYNAITFR